MIEKLLKSQVEKKINSFSDENEITIEINFIENTATIFDSKKKAVSQINSMEKSVCKNLAKSKLNIDAVDGIRLKWNKEKNSYIGTAYYQKGGKKLSSPFNF